LFVAFHPEKGTIITMMVMMIMMVGMIMADLTPKFGPN
jgi:hypothetical protein